MTAASFPYCTHREQRQKLEARVVELEKQLQEYAKKIAERKSGN